jgi:hypothetical protein
MIEITGIWTDRADQHRHAGDTVTTTLDDERMFFNVTGSDKTDAVRFNVFMDGARIYFGGTNLDADGRQTVVFNVPSQFRTVGKHALKIELLDANDDGRPDIEVGVYDVGEYTVIYQ